MGALALQQLCIGIDWWRRAKVLISHAAFRCPSSTASAFCCCSQVSSRPSWFASCARTSQRMPPLEHPLSHLSQLQPIFGFIIHRRSYNALPSEEEAAEMAEETGWKLVYARPCLSPTASFPHFC